MNSLPLLFSSTDYFKDYNFVRLMRNWNKYLTYEDYNSNEPEQMMAEWEEWLLKDFYEGATQWLKKNPNSLFSEEFI